MRLIVIATLLLIQPRYPAKFIEDLALKHRNEGFFIVVPILDKNKTVNICIENTYLYDFIYKPNYIHSHPSFAKFLDLALTQKLLIQRKYVPDFLFLPVNSKSKVLEFYKKHGFTATQKKYLLSSDGHLISRPGSTHKLDRNEVFNLYKIMFEHGYYSGFDDYIGVHVFFTPSQLSDL